MSKPCSDGASNGCPAWIKPRTFEANLAISEGGPQGKSKASQSMAPPRQVGNWSSGHQFASFAPAAVDETTNF
jgi:hypothetical protein